MIEPCYGKPIFMQCSYTKKYHYLTRCAYGVFCVYFLLKTINAVGRVVFYRCIIYSRLLLKVIYAIQESQCARCRRVSWYFSLLSNEHFMGFVFLCLPNLKRNSSSNWTWTEIWLRKGHYLYMEVVIDPDSNDLYYRRKVLYYISMVL